MKTAVLAALLLVLAAYCCGGSGAAAAAARGPIDVAPVARGRGPAATVVGAGFCDVCMDVVAYLQQKMLQTSTQDELGQVFDDICVDFKLFPQDVCQGFINEFKSIVLTVFAEKVFNPRAACSLLRFCNSSAELDGRRDRHARIELPPKPEPLPPLVARKVAPGTIKHIAHLTDMHYDPFYAEGAVVACGKPLCCRLEDGMGNGTNAAPKWGSYTCDASPLMLDFIIESIEAMNPRPDYVFWTGDNPPHDVWKQSQEEQTNATIYLAKRLHELNVRVFPAMGNHESYPVNIFGTPSQMGWLYNAMADSYADWIPAADLVSFRYGGYYSTLVEPGIRVVSVNMNYCNNGNYWLLLNDTDPAEQLAWLTQTLQAAETAGEKVFVLGHIPPGNDDCLMHWGQRYMQIINRFESTVIAQFMGHTHKDHFEVMYADDGHPTNVVYIAPSVTTFTNINPSVRVYDVDWSALQVADHHTYHVDLQDANQHDNPTFELFYSAKDKFGMKGLAPSDWDYVVNRAVNDDDFVQELWSIMHTGHHVDTCDANCARLYLCQIRSGSFTDVVDCMGGAWDTKSLIFILESKMC